MKRLAIYVHYHPQGLVEDYIMYCLNGLKQVVDEILVVVNGSLSGEARARLEEAGVDILVRENKGFDFWGWRAGLEYYGYDRVARLESLLLTNNTYYGPIFPFSEMWNDMEKEECDFWGLTWHPETDARVIKKDPKTKIHGHIQSYWMVFRNTILQNDCFKAYWNGLRPYNTWSEAVGYGETQLTRHFEQCGFKAKTWVNPEKSHDLVVNPFFMNDALIINNRCPTLKRKFLSGLDGDFKKKREGYSVSELLAYLEKNKLYDTDMIWDDLLRNHHMSTIIEHLNLCYIMPSTCRLPPAKNDSQPRVAAIFYIFYEDLVEYCYQYAASLPSGIDVFVVTTDSKVAEKSRNFFGRLANKVEYRHQPNRGRDNAALLVTCKDIFTSYDLFCFMHGKKSKYSSQDAIRGEEFRAHCFVCLLHNENYVRNIIETFRSKERLGLMVPLLPTGFGYDYIIYDRWGPNHAHAERFIKDDLKMDVSLDPDVIAPYGGMFWARTGALKTVVGRGWGYEDFPEEPFPANDGLLPHVLERVLPLLAQHDGYYTAMAAPEFYANAALTTLFSMPNKMRATIPGDIVTYISLYGRYLRYCLLLKLPFPKYREKYLDKKYRLRAKFNRLKNLLIS